MRADGAPEALIEIACIADVLQRLPEGHAAWLSDSEQARLAEIRNDRRRDQYLAGHWLARTLLARAFGGEVAAWSLLEQRSRPPCVDGHGVLSVSISHTNRWIAAAVATTAIGIDLEQRPRALDAGIEPMLRNADEVAGSLDADVLLQRWVAKEAWLKRRMESALPERLKRLELHALARDPADTREADEARNAGDVRIDSSDAFHFGVAVASNCKLALRCGIPLHPGPAFRVVDLDA